MALLLMLVLLPAIEIYLFIALGGTIGAGWTLLLVFLTALWGLSAMRAQGLAVLAEAQAAQAAGRSPVAAAAHGVLILSGGLMLLIPGFFTDTLGFLLILRPLRALLLDSLLAAFMPQIIAGLTRRAATRPTPGQPDSAASRGRPNGRPSNSPGNNVIEGDYRVEPEDTHHDTQNGREK